MQVILQMLADMRLVQDAYHASCLELAARPDARQHQEVRRADCARAENNLFGSVSRVRLPNGNAIFDALGGAPFQNDADRLRAGDDRQIGPRLRRALKKSGIGARSSAVARGGLEEGGDVLGSPAAASVVVATFVTRCFRGLHEFA